MRHVDFTPLYRSTVGFDRLFSMLDTLAQPEGGQSYPPYNIERTGDDAYRITLATAGFAESELEVTAQPNLLIVAGQKGEAEDGRTYLHRGLAHRSFERRFELADYVVVRDARYVDGLLTIDLAREIPDALRPRRIEIGAAAGSPVARLSPGGEQAA